MNRRWVQRVETKSRRDIVDCGRLKNCSTRPARVCVRRAVVASAHWCPSRVPRPWAVRALADGQAVARAVQNKAWDNGDDHPDEDEGLTWGVVVE